MTILGLVIGLVFGVVITRYYDYKGLHRGANNGAA
ncbi:Uncharacterised protein [Mycobacteroides abscessus subsp. abscessus]|nr:Uncharacterised protein [Mycobacteroides abscessus subsp. abscessus]